MWACFDGEGYGDFPDIDKITMFADYRVPQILNSMGCLYYSPKLVSSITRHQLLEPGCALEIQLRGKSPPYSDQSVEVEESVLTHLQVVVSGAWSSSGGRSSRTTPARRSTPS